MSRFTIILPVRNGGEYLKTCVAGILAQTFTEFELAILENASTDGTADWIKTFTDPRVKLYSTPEPLTIEQNWLRALDIPKNEFMTIIGHDDFFQPHYLQTMVNLILEHPAASLYQTHFSYIDANGKLIRDCHPMPETESAASFLSNYLQRKTDVMGTGFMMRSADYHKVGGIPLYPNLLFADFELWIRLTGFNYKATARENCFSFRIHQSTTTISPDKRFQDSFGRFIDFLASLSAVNDDCRKAIEQHGEEYLLHYCQGLSHRLLRTSVSKRGGLTVSGFVRQCKQYASKLGLPSSFNPARRPSIRMAILLDSNALTRSLFLGFKKIYSQPVLR